MTWHIDRTAEFEQLTAGRCESKPKRYIPLSETTSLVAKIHKMRAHLLKYGHDYLGTYNYLPGACVMTDERRAKLDIDVEEFIKSCDQKIKILQSEMKLGSCSQQVLDHHEAVIRIVKRILNELFTCFNHLKTTKITRQTEKQKFDRIESSVKLSASFEDYFDQGHDQDNAAHDSEYNYDRDKLYMVDEHNLDIDPAQMQSLAMENSRIHEELITLDDEVRLIGKKVVQISQLQELFTEKVMEQNVDLISLHETAIRSSENLREGNDLIREAMMKNASTRVFILFYIVTLGFTILFLDWYNP